MRKRKKKFRPAEVRRSPSQIVRRDGDLFVRCKCRKLDAIGAYAAAHLGQCELRGKCSHCGTTIVIEVE